MLQNLKFLKNLVIAAKAANQEKTLYSGSSPEYSEFTVTILHSFMLFLSMIRLKRIPKDIYSKISVLSEFLSYNPNVIFAYLFGGLLKQKVNPLSDVDIALYVKDSKKLNYLELFSKITDIIKTDELDLIILNESPVSIAGRIIQNKKNLVDKQPLLRYDYESLTLRKFFDFAVKERDILQRRYGIG